MFGSRGKERVNNRKPKTERDSGHKYWCDSCHAVFNATSLPLVLSTLFTHQNLITIADLLKSSNLNHYDIKHCSNHHRKPNYLPTKHHTTLMTTNFFDPKTVLGNVGVKSIEKVLIGND